MDSTKTLFDMSILNRRISLCYVLTVLLAWCFLVRDFKMPLQLETMSKILLVALLVCSMHFLYRKVSILINIKVTHLLWLLGAFFLLIFMNRSTISASLAGDELYHSDHSTLGLKIVEIAAQSFPGWTWLQLRPIPELMSYMNLLFIGTALLAIYVWNHIKTRIPSLLKITALMISLLALGFFCQNLPNRLEMHPPLRLLPLFLSQITFGFDDISFRLAGIIIFSILLAYTGNWVSKRANSQLAGFLAVLSIISIPAVSHVAGIVEPSIWAHCCWIGTFFIIDPNTPPKEAHEKHDRLIKCGLWIGCFSLARQTAIVLWPLVIIYLTIWKCNWRTWFLALLPGTFMMPVLYTINQGHPASSGSPIANVLQSIVTGLGPKALLNSMTPVWIGIIFVLIIYVIIHFRSHRIWPFLLSFVPAYILYFSIWDYLWGLGRYHAEFLGGLTGILLISILSQSHRILVMKLTIPILATLSFASFTLTTLNQDANYSIWPQRRITTESVYPYRESLGFLKRQDTQGKFVFLGAVPVYGELFLYLRGFSLAEISMFRSIQQKFEKELEKIHNIEDLKTSLDQIGAQWLVVQYGEKREKQHRSAIHSKLYKIIGEGKKNLDHPPYSFIGSYEGAIDLYPLEKAAGY